MKQLDKFKKLFEESSAVKPFSFDYDGKKLDLSSVKGVMERKNDRQFRMIYDVIPNLLRVILEVNRSDNTDHVPVTSPDSRMYGGRISITVKTLHEPGEITLFARSEESGIKSAFLNIESYEQ